MLDSLLEEIKSFLNFTWVDEDRDKRIRNYTLSSIQYLNEVAGTSINFTEDFLAKDLLFNRVLYMDSQALNEFKNNYSADLKELQIKYDSYSSIQ